MPNIVGRHNGRQVFTPVVLFPVEEFTDTPDPQRLSKFPHHQVLRALIDTGATGTCITEAAARKLNLEPSGVVGVQGVNGADYHPSYIFKLGFVDLQQDELGYQNPRFDLFDEEIEGPRFDCGAADFDVLLGMDVLSRGTLTISKLGTFKFSY
ncbi:MAG: aspartyl protease family protein [Sphingomonas sp.]|nr:aspartyl protease family protein [Sphingomonas sp.]